MDIATFHTSRRFADVESGRIAFFEKGHGPTALFVHGVFFPEDRPDTLAAPMLEFWGELSKT